MTGGGLKLNLGCGGNILEGFINIDAIEPPENRNANNFLAPFIKGDMREYIHSIPSNSVKHILMSHSLEHIPKEDAKRILEECFRVLQNEGFLEIICPDHKWWMTQYLAGEVNIELVEIALYGNRLNEYEIHKWSTDALTLCEMIKKANFTILGKYTGDGNVAIHAKKTL